MNCIQSSGDWKRLGRKAALSSSLTPDLTAPRKAAVPVGVRMVQGQVVAGAKVSDSPASSWLLRGEMNNRSLKSIRHHRPTDKRLPDKECPRSIQVSKPAMNINLEQHPPSLRPLALECQRC